MDTLDSPKGTALVNTDTVSADSDKRGKLQCSLGGLLLLLAVWGVLPSGTWPQTYEEEPTDFDPPREPVFVIDDVAGAVALQSDDKIVVAGRADRGFAVARYHPDGRLDTSFGIGGKATTRISTDVEIDDEFHDLALQADGKIVVAGRAYMGLSNDFALVRYNPDGSLDTSFGTKGIVTTDFTPAGMRGGLGFHYPNYDDAFAVAIQTDGKLVVGGTTLARYHPDGSVDTSFGMEGQVRTETPVRALVVQRDGKLVAVGGEGTFVLTRYYPDGGVDSGFGMEGTVTTQVGMVDGASDVALQADGKFVVVGTSLNDHSIDFAMVRYHPDGSLDRSFGTGGKVTSDFCARKVTEEYVDVIGRWSISGSWRVGVQTDGKIVVTGTPSNVLCSGSVMFRYNSDGSLDTTFGESGRVTTAMTRNDGSFGAQVIQDDGKIVVVGTSGKGFAVARYNPDGTLDHTFGTDGKVTTRIGTGYTVW